MSFDDDTAGFSRAASVDVDGLCDILAVQLGLEEEEPLTIRRFPGLEGYECHLNWLSPADKLTKKGVQTVINVLNDKVNENTQDGLATLKYLGIESICYRTTLAFFNAVLGNHIEAQYHLIAATDDIAAVKQNQYVDEEYLQGLRYVLKGVNVYNFLVNQQKDSGENQLSEGDIRKLGASLEGYEGFSVKTKVGVHAGRHYFEGQMRRPHDPQIEHLKTMIAMDPDYYLWHFNLYSQYRFQRRAENYRSSPIDEEVKEILRAVELAPDHPLVLVGSCICVAEVMKTHGADGFWRQPMRYGNREFKSVQAVVDFIKLQTKKILEAHQETVRINIHISECFSFLLPHDYRDMEFAKECIQRALQFHPNSSKAHHRMGNFLLGNNGTMEESIAYFTRAIECDMRNFPAKADLMKALMHEPEKNCEKILELIDGELASTGHNNSRFASIHFIKGCFYLLTHNEKNPDNEVNAALEWLKACEISSDSLDFKTMFLMSKRYQWPRGKLTHKAVSAAIQSLAQSGKVDSSNEHLLTLEKIAQRNKDEAVQHYQQTRAGNNTRGRGGARNGFPLQRRRSDGVMMPAASAPPANTGDKTVPPQETARRPRRWSNSNDDNGGLRVIVIRQPRNPQGPGFLEFDRTATGSLPERDLSHLQ